MGIKEYIDDCEGRGGTLHVDDALILWRDAWLRNTYVEVANDSPWMTLKIKLLTQLLDSSLDLLQLDVLHFLAVRGEVSGLLFWISESEPYMFEW